MFFFREKITDYFSDVGGSVESLSKMKKKGSNSNMHAAEAMDRVTDLGPSLGLKKSSSLESLQTMVHEIQMADEPRGPVALRTPRGRGRDEILRAAVESPPGKTINNNSPSFFFLHGAQ